MGSDGRNEFTIGELAKAARVTIRTLRHYDRLRLLTPASRSIGSQRRYGPVEISRLYRILALRSLGLPLSAISDLLDSDNSEALLTIMQRQLEEVTQQLALYEDMRERLLKVVDTLHRSNAPSPDELFEIMEVMTMTIRLSRIYTRTGDSGETHLGDRSRVRKTDPRIEAIGDVDELSCQIGLAIATGDVPERHVAWLRRIQNDLYDVGADLAVPTGDAQAKARLRIGPEYVKWLETKCDELNSRLEPLRSFVLPGGTVAASQIHLCRTVCRRAERTALKLEDANPEIIRYLNRLSDLFFIAARVVNDGKDHLWEPGRHAPAAGDGVDAAQGAKR